MYGVGRRRQDTLGSMETSASKALQCFFLLAFMAAGRGRVHGLECYVGIDGNYGAADCSAGVCRIVDCLCAKIVHTGGRVTRDDT